MILADYLAAESAYARTDVERATLFVLDDRAAATCAHLAANRKLLMARDYIVMPCEKFWIEWSPGPGRLRGIMVTTEDTNIRRGLLQFMCMDRQINNSDDLCVYGLGTIDLDHPFGALMVAYDKENWKTLLELTGAGANDLVDCDTMGKEPRQNIRAPSIGELLLVAPAAFRFGTGNTCVGESTRLLLALLIALNSPKLFERKAVDFKRLNRLRAKKKKAPLLSHELVRLDLAAAGCQGSEVSTPRGTSCGVKARHFVRAFLRLRLGQVELVRHHHRGDARLGSPSRGYKVTDSRRGSRL